MQLTRRKHLPEHLLCLDDRDPIAEAAGVAAAERNLRVRTGPHVEEAFRAEDVGIRVDLGICVQQMAACPQLVSRFVPNAARLAESMQGQF
nr:hypothetical protein [Frankia sp. QA3]